jgi:hypothetical protein
MKERVSNMRKDNSLLLARVPPSRGVPVHIEHGDDTAVTVISRKDVVTEMHTPQCTLRRIHESMHARHTRDRDAATGVPEIVAQIVEDCRLHLKHWPWPHEKTPRPVQDDVAGFVLHSLGRLAKAIDEKKIAATDASVFMESIRAAAVINGMTGSYDPGMQLLPVHLQKFARRCLNGIQYGRQQEAAENIAALFFPGEPVISKPGRRRKGEGKGLCPVTMEIVDLPKTERCGSAEAGQRLATSGARIHRPALRRPVLPARLFVRQTYLEPAGTILIDASGSMGRLDCIEKKMRQEPQATIAYYQGASGRRGKLFIYAKDGWRAAEPENFAGGNVIDGPAIDWLLQQEGPLTMITDRRFCGAPDSELQIFRLKNLELEGRITVRDYDKEDETGE